MLLSKASIQARIGNKSEPRTPGDIVHAITKQGVTLVTDWKYQVTVAREAYFLHHNTIRIMEREGWLFNIEHNAALDGVVYYRLTTAEQLRENLPSGASDARRVAFHAAYCLAVIPAEYIPDDQALVDFAQSSATGLGALGVINSKFGFFVKEMPDLVRPLYHHLTGQ